MNKRYLILILCIIGSAILSMGCTTQSGDGITPVPTTIPSTTPAITTTTPPPILTTAIPGTTATPGITPSGETRTPTTAPGGPDERISIKARNFAFDRSIITAPAGSRVIVEFENEDGAPHNVAFYTSPSLSATIYKGEIVTGPRRITYTFTAPSNPGTYYFRCDVHPSMDGQFIVT